MLARSFYLSVSLVLVGTMLAACTTTPAEPGITGSDGSASSNATAEPASSVSPLDEFMGGSAWNNQEDFQRAVNEFNVRREELIAQCMNEAGFEYRPDVNSGSWSISTPLLDDVNSNDREWITQYGFGIISGQASFSGGSIWDTRDDDPNAEIVESLSESERAAYQIALRGPEDAFPTEQGFDWNEFMSTSQGCWGRAVVQAQSENALFLRQADEFTPLFEALEEVYVALREDPDFVAAESDWSNCMADAGHPGFGSPISASNSMWEPLFDLQFEMELSMPQVRDAVNTGSIPLPEGFDAAQMRNNEIELALADLDCRASTNYSARVDAVQHALEAQFVTDHRAALEAYRDAEAQRG